ncbi:hypothetical protein HBI75_106830 [Parastagonospora nodorum]|nr:hypothetical protein HBI75_106830 [Parastagonospora nodorum]
MRPSLSRHAFFSTRLLLDTPSSRHLRGVHDLVAPAPRALTRQKTSHSHLSSTFTDGAMRGRRGTWS